MFRYFRLIIRIILIAIPLIVLGWLIDRNFALSSPLVVEHDFSKPSAFISFLKPTERVGKLVHKEGDIFRVIKGDPVYFELSLPNKFFKIAEVELEYNNLSQPLMELGIQVGKDWQYKLKPLINQILDNLEWPRLRDGDIFVYERQPRYKTVSDFLDNLPSPSQIATYNYNLKYNYQLSDYEPREDFWELNKSLRGAHEIITYIKDEPLYFTFSWQDMNRHQEPDPISLTVYNWNGRQIFSKTIPDSKGADKIPSLLKKTEIKLADLPTGAYKIKWQAGDDIFIRKIKTGQSRLAFRHKLYLGDTIDYDGDNEQTAAYVSGKYLRAVTTHKEGLQNLLMGDQKIKIKETHKQYYKELTPGLKQIISPANDLLLQSDGLFVFERRQFFNPYPLAVDENFDPNKDQVNFIIAKYTKPEEVGGWKKSGAVFDLDKAKIKDGKIKFVISAPGLSEKEKYIYLNKIKITLKSEDFTVRELGGAFLNYFKRFL